ncbi:MAG: urate hydroxylase PuuD [Woeseia sp.]
MEAYIVDWLNLLGRSVHFVTGIAWIGASFYFIWLDNHLVAPREHTDEEKGVGGEVWSVHGGGFYHAQKYRVSPPQLPETLHWFKWEAYSTWLSGMFLLSLIYWYGAEIYLIDRSVAELSVTAAIGIGAAAIVAGWVVYDLLCRSPLGNNDAALGAVLFVLTAALAWGLCQVFSGRGAYIHYGAVLGTIMVANVFFVIMPGQRAMVSAAARGEAPDPAPGRRAKQRSVHNTYFTLPVLFVMISNHYALTYAHRYNWLILVALSLAGALIRAWFVARHSGRASPWPLAAAAALLLGTAFVLAPRPTISEGIAVTLDDVRPVIEHRCVNCHARQPVHPGFQAPPAGVVLDDDSDIMAEAERIHQQTVVLRSMPIGNLTAMTDEERALVDAWYRGIAESRE